MVPSHTLLTDFNTCYFSDAWMVWNEQMNSPDVSRLFIGNGPSKWSQLFDWKVSTCHLLYHYVPCYWFTYVHIYTFAHRFSVFVLYLLLRNHSCKYRNIGLWWPLQFSEGSLTMVHLHQGCENECDCLLQIICASVFGYFEWRQRDTLKMILDTL